MRTFFETAPKSLLHLLFSCAFIWISGFLFSAYATSYYVSETGNDDATGTSPETPWQTIDKVNSVVYLPGDEILFKRGETWRMEELLVSSSGKVDNPVTYGPYGEGENPQLLGSLLAGSWTKITGNIWASVAAISTNPRSVGYDAPEIFFEEHDRTVNWGLYRGYDAAFSQLTAEFHWTWNADTIYVYAPSDPAVRYSKVEVPQLAIGIRLLDHNYVTITGLSLKYYADAGVYDSYSTPTELFGLKVTKCEIAYIGQKNGAAAYGLNVHHSDSYYGSNEIHDCGRRGISLTMYQTAPSIQRNVVIENNRFHHGWHTTSLDCNTAGPHTIENIVFRNNLVEGDQAVVLGGENSNSNHVFIANQSGGAGNIHDLYFYNNIFTWASGSSIKSETVSKVYVHNNSFYNFNPSLANWQAHVYTSGVDDDFVIENNIFHNNATDNRWTAIKVDESDRQHFLVNHNLYYQSESGKRFWWVDGGTSYKDYEWEDYRTATGNDADSPEPDDPLFLLAPSDLSLQQNSPARGAGTGINWITMDILGQPVNNPPDLGAIQYRQALSGDIDGDGAYTLKDVIIGLQLLTGEHNHQLSTDSDQNGDQRIGLEEVLFLLQQLK